jgi:hypothetical protein
LSEGNVKKLPVCGATKPDGTACERIVGAPGKPCYAHDDTRKADRRASASKAAKSKLSSEIVSIRAEARQIMVDLREHRLTRGDANVLLQGCNLLLKSVSEARKQSEFDDVRAEIAELRDLYEARRDSFG